MESTQQPTPKQNVIELVRSGESIVIATAKNPTRDQIAAAIGLRLLLDKLDKVTEVVIASSLPKELDFLPTKLVNPKLQGQRDFVVEIDQSQTEADHLKYVTEDHKLKIYITPYNGVYSDKDVSFSYGDYHCDVIIGLGVTNPSQLDPAVTKEKKLTDKAQFVFIAPSGEGGGELSWSDSSASSVCEMVMSMSEALGSGMMDKDIATALFTGIVDTTEHFTNSATTPKVMTMAAQLLAAGARQAEVVKKLRTAASPADKPKDTESKSISGAMPAKEPTPPPSAPAPPPNEFQIRQPKAAPASPAPEAPPKEQPTSPPPQEPQPAPLPEPQPASPPAPASVQSPPPPAEPLNPPPSPPPAASAPAPPPSHPPSSLAGPNEKVIQPPGPATPPNDLPAITADDLEAARRAVEEAHGGDQSQAT